MKLMIIKRLKINISWGLSLDGKQNISKDAANSILSIKNRTITMKQWLESEKKWQVRHKIAIYQNTQMYCGSEDFINKIF